jgi:lipopolysaccharide export system permease protein
MRKIDRYIMQQFLAGLLPVMLLLLALFSFLALGEELEDVGTGGFKLPDALMVVFLTTPKRVVDLLPVAVLLGGLLGLGAMANNRELIAIRSSGLSKRHIALVVTLVAVLLAICITVLQFTLVPRFEREAANLRGKSLQGTEKGPDNTGAFWTRNGDHFIYVSDVKFDRTLSDIEIYTTDDRGRLSQLVQASSAYYLGDSSWLLRGVLRSEPGQTQVQETKQTSLQWPDLLSAEQAAVLILPLPALSPGDLVRMIANLKRNQLDTHEYEIAFWQQVSLLPGLLAMALLSLPFLLGSVRSVSAGQRVIIGGGIGIGFYLIQQLSGHLAGILGVNPVIAMLSPPLILLVIAITAIRHRSL